MKKMKGKMVSGCNVKPHLCLMVSPPPHNTSLFNLESMKWEPDSDDSGTVALGTIDTEAFLKYVEYEQRKLKGEKKLGVLRGNKETNGVLSPIKHSLEVSLPLNLVTVKNHHKRNLGDAEDCGVKKSKLSPEKLQKDKLKKSVDHSESDDSCPLIEDIDMNDEEMEKLLHFNRVMLSENGKIDIFSPKKNINDDILKSPVLHIYLQDLSSPKTKLDTKYPDPNFTCYSSNNSRTKIDEKTLLNQIYETFNFREEIISETESEETKGNDSCLKEIVETENVVETVNKSTEETPNVLSSRDKIFKYNFLNEELDFEGGEEDHNLSPSSNIPRSKSSLTPSPQTETKESKVKWNSKEFLKKLSDKVPENGRLNILNEPEKVTVAATSAKNSDSELEIFPRMYDELDKEFNQESVEIKNNSDCSRVKSTAKPISRSISLNCQPSKQSLQTKRPSNLENATNFREYIKQGLYGKGLDVLRKDLVIDNPNYESIGMRLKELVTVAEDKDLTDIILQCCDIYLKCFKNLRSSLARDIYELLLLASKNRKDALRASIVRIYEALVEDLPDRPLIFHFHDEMCDALLEIVILTEKPKWRSVANLLHFVMGVCKIVPRAKWVDTVLAILPKFQNLSSTIYKLLMLKPCGQILFQKLDTELVKNFHLLLKSYNHPGYQLIGRWITKYHPTIVNPVENIEPSVDNNSNQIESFVPNICQKIADCFALEKWMELTNLFNLFVEKKEYGVIQIIYNELWNCGENASSAYKKIVNSIQWASFGSPLHSDQLEIIGQMGIGIMIQFHDSKLYKHAFEIIKTLHKSSIMYYELQKSLSLTKFGGTQSFYLSSMILTPNQVALRAVKVCYEILQILEAFLILNACSWCRGNLNADETDEKRRILNEMLSIILTSSSKFNSNNLKEILINSVKLVEELFELTENNFAYMSEYEELFNEFFVLVLNSSLKNEVDRLIEFFNRSLVKCAIHLSPAVERGIFVLFSRSGVNLEPLFMQLTLHGIFYKNNISERTVKVKSYFTIEELEACFSLYLKNLYSEINTKKKYQTFAEKYLLKIKVVLRSRLPKDCCGIASLEAGSTLESCYTRITEALTKKLTPPLEIAQNLGDYRLIIIKPYSVFTYFCKNFDFSDPSMLEYPSFSGGTSTESTSKIHNNFFSTSPQSLLSRISTLPNNPLPAPTKAIRSIDRSAFNTNTNSESIGNDPGASTSGYDPKLIKTQKNLKPPKGVLKLQTPIKKIVTPFKRTLTRGTISNSSARFGSVKSYKLKPKLLNLRRTINNTSEEHLSTKNLNFAPKSNELPCKKDWEIKASWVRKTKISLTSSNDERTSFIPKSPDIPPPIKSLSTKTNVKKVATPPCEVSDPVRKKIEQFLKMEIQKMKKDVSISKSLTQSFITEMCLKFKCKTLNLNPKIMKELFAFAKTNV